MSQVPFLPEWAVDDIDPNVASMARIYDYLLGGSHHFAVDRQWSDELERMWPGIKEATWANRAFLRRVVTFCAEQGITQYLDIGSGIPTAGNVHEILVNLGVDARVVYIDNDPVANVISQRLLTDVPWASAVRADFADPDGILATDEVAQGLDFDKPIAVLLLSILHVVGDAANPPAVIARLRDRIPSGSVLAISHFTNEGWTDDQLAELLRMSRETSTPGRPRSAAEITTLFDGFEVVDPGVVRVSQWRTDPAEGAQDSWLDWIGGVGIKP